MAGLAEGCEGPGSPGRAVAVGMTQVGGLKVDPGVPW